MGRAATPATSCRNCLRESFILNLPLRPFLQSPRRRGRLSLCVRAARQAHRKDRTFAGLARHCHVTAHQARELTSDGKAESRAPETLCSRGIGLAELLEQLGLLLRCWTRPMWSPLPELGECRRRVV